MLKYCIFGFVWLTVAVITDAQNVETSSIRKFQVTTPFDLVRAASYSQVSEDLNGVMETLNQTNKRWVGTAVSVSLND
jgi:hypothetical protein